MASGSAADIVDVELHNGWRVRCVPVGKKGARIIAIYRAPINPGTTFVSTSASPLRIVCCGDGDCADQCIDCPPNTSPRCVGGTLKCEKGGEKDASVDK
jgi:hypothetical protein